MEYSYCGNVNCLCFLNTTKACFEWKYRYIVSTNSSNQFLDCSEITGDNVNLSNK